MIRFACPVCKTSLQSRDQDSGTKFACPACGQRLQVPAPPPPNRTVLGQPLPAPNKTVLGNPEPDISVVRSPRGRPAFEDDDSCDDFDDERRYRRTRHEFQPNTGAGTACSVLSVIFGCIAFLLCPLLFGIAGLVLGIVGTVLSENKALGIVGIVLSVLGTVCGMMLGLLLLAH